MRLLRRGLHRVPTSALAHGRPGQGGQRYRKLLKGARQSVRADVLAGKSRRPLAIHRRTRAKILAKMMTHDGERAKTAGSGDILQRHASIPFE